MIEQSEWKWFGTPGHFICAQWCRFHLCTKVGTYLISTLGEYVHPRHSAGSEATEAEWLKDNWPGEDIGCDRKYETMVFKAGKGCAKPACRCGLPAIDCSDVDGAGYNMRGEAMAGHMRLCRKWAKKQRAKAKGAK